MGQRYQEIPAKQIEFIRDQKIFFVGTAGGDDTRVNVSPKGLDSVRVLSPTAVGPGREESRPKAGLA